MLTIIKTTEGNSMNIALEGRLDSVTAPELEKTIKESIKDLSELTLDFAGLKYVSSPGLRVLLEAHMNMALNEGKMKLTNVNENIMEILKITGFSDILNIN